MCESCARNSNVILALNCAADWMVMLFEMRAFQRLLDKNPLPIQPLRLTMTTVDPTIFTCRITCLELGDY
eukprot:2984117-Amphidinium_carterae.1